MDTLIRTRVFEHACVESGLGLQSSRHHWKVLDEIYNVVVGSRLGHGVEAAPAANLCGENVFFLRIPKCFQRFGKCSGPLESQYFNPRMRTWHWESLKS